MTITGSLLGWLTHIILRKNWQQGALMDIAVVLILGTIVGLVKLSTQNGRSAFLAPA